MSCNAFHSFSHLSECVPLPERSNGNAAPPHQLMPTPHDSLFGQCSTASVGGWRPNGHPVPQLAGHFIATVLFTVYASTLPSIFYWKNQNYLESPTSWLCTVLPPRLAHTPLAVASPPCDAFPHCSSCLQPDCVLDRPPKSHYLQDGLALLPMRQWPTPPAPH